MTDPAVVPEPTDELCPECGGDPQDNSLHRDGCPRIDTLNIVQCGPPWLPLERIARAVEPGWMKRISHFGANADVYSVHYPDGMIRIEHACKVVDELQVICAPALQLGNGHQVVKDDPLTVTPSIACTDCGLHGFITEGKWVPA